MTEEIDTQPPTEASETKDDQPSIPKIKPHICPACGKQRGHTLVCPMWLD